MNDNIVIRIDLLHDSYTNIRKMFDDPNVKRTIINGRHYNRKCIIIIDHIEENRFPKSRNYGIPLWVVKHIDNVNTICMTSDWQHVDFSNAQNVT